MDSILIVLIIIIATILTRSLPFIIFNPKRPAPKFLLYLGKVLPMAVVGMLIVYCLKAIDLSHSPFGFNEIIALLCVVFLQCVFKMSILSIVVGTILYMFLVQTDWLSKFFF
ncbi:AzlD domain-containing protein [Helicobacter sp. 13S00477-4]|uniref:branched-chain amino acid transporter permease n=1 Tax=Helicobacter sp. 13S00477-4 TaxID=1905759 RepID=UPI000BA7CBBA|nr:AzlD domain-containing protein [Helicobacter sp. 13S00477-4]PAF50331.1 branched-chain amino acid transporter AzlD [Helicobacter sp. 13S00477-4]